MRSTHLLSFAAAVALCAIAACDNDPTVPRTSLQLLGCPSGALDVNAPISLTFSEPLTTATINTSDVVVSDAVTGFQIPGTLTFDATHTTVTFQPSQAFTFSEPIRIRIQNLVAEKTNQVIPVTLCSALTEPPPITELWWNRLPAASGTRLIDIAQTAVDTGYALSIEDPLFKKSGPGDFAVVYNNPRFDLGEAIGFVNSQHGWASYEDVRQFTSVLVETHDGGLTFDTATVVDFEDIDKIWFTDTLFTGGKFFGVAAGGTSGHSTFWKYDSTAKALTETGSFTGTAGVLDVDFGADTVNGAAVSQGNHAGSFWRFGKVFTTNDGGASWTDLTAYTADTATLTYRGVAMRSNGEIFVVGGNGTAFYLSPNGGGYTRTDILQNAVANPDTTNPFALIYTDVEFSKANDNIGWIIGAQLETVVGGVPQYRGLIFYTTDGGRTWTRQGLRGGPNYGAEFPRLNRISVLSPTHAWIAGDGGTVLDFQP